MKLVSEDDYNRFLERDAAYEGLRADSRRASELAGRIAVWEAADEATQAARRVLEGPDQLAALTQTAREQAQEAAERAERQRLIDLHAARIAQAEGVSWAETYRQENEEGIIAALRKQYTEDGTFAKIRSEAEQGVQARLQDKVVAAGRAEIDAEVAATEPAALQTAKTAWLEGRYGAQYRVSAVNKMRERVTAMAPDEVRAEIDDEEYGRLLRERAEREKTELAIEAKAKELAASFERGGIKCMEILEDSHVILELGEIEIVNKKKRVPRPGRPGYMDEVMADVAVCTLSRRLTMTALGNGLFVVDGDSLHDSKSAHDRNAALAIGAVVTLGRKLNVAGEVRLEPRLRADVELYYDLDPKTTDEFDESYGKLANVTIDGVKARPELEIVE